MPIPFEALFASVTTKYKDAKGEGPDALVEATQEEMEAIMTALVTLMTLQSQAVEYLETLSETVDAGIARHVLAVLGANLEA